MAGQRNNQNLPAPDGVSVIICGYNAAGRIRPTLKALQEQEFRDTGISWEVILVDNASTDQTAETALSKWNEAPVTDFRVIREENPGLMHARKKGLAEARYGIISFIDDDNWVEKHWVEKVFSVFTENNNIGACGGRSEPVFEKEMPDWFPSFEKSFAVGKQLDKNGIIEGPLHTLWGAGLSFRKQIWTELQRKGFSTLTIGRQGKKLSGGEDTELCYAIRLLGFSLFYSDDLVLKHYMPEARLNLDYMKKMYMGFGAANVRLNLYRVFLSPDVFRLYSWWYEFLVALKNIMKCLLKSKFSGNRIKKWEFILQQAYWRGYAVQMWKDRYEIKTFIEQVRFTFLNTGK